MNNINSKLFVIAQYLLSAIILVLSFKHHLEILLFICMLVSVAMGMIFINEFKDDKAMFNCSLIGEFIVLIIIQGYLEYNIISNFTWIRAIMFLLNAMIFIIYYYYITERIKG